MARISRLTRTFFVTLLSIGSTIAAQAETDNRTRVTIRGTGNNVSIDRTESPAAPAKEPELWRRTAPSSVLSEAIHMKEAKASDELVISFLKERASRLPIVVDLDTLRRLRAAGAGKPVIAYLSSVSAIEIGASGAVGGGPVTEYPSSSEPEYEPGFAAQYGYPILGGYAAPSGRSGFHSFRRPGMMRFPHAPAFVRPMLPIPAQRPPLSPLRRLVFGVR